MLFNVELDEGHTVVGYVVPDNGGEHPMLRVFDGAVPVAELVCNEMRDAVRAAGRHATGMVGFRFDEHDIPGLARRADLAIRDGRSNLLIYRRPRPDHVRLRVLRLETQMAPLTGLDDSLAPAFQYVATGAERFGLETVNQLFQLHMVDSVYHSGRHLLRNFEAMTEDMVRIVVLADPFIELAERIAMLRGGTVPDHLSDRDAILLEPAFDWFADVAIDADRALARSLARIPAQAADAVRHPLLAQLTCARANEPVDLKALAPALDSLSRFDVVGFRDEPERVAGTIGGLLGIPSGAIDVPPVSGEVNVLADRLRALPSAERLVANDLILIHHVRRAMAQAAEGETGLPISMTL